jgi:hypothetical protein
LGFVCARVDQPAADVPTWRPLIRWVGIFKVSRVYTIGPDFLEGANNTLPLEQAAAEGYSFYKQVSANQLCSIKARAGFLPIITDGNRPTTS